MMFITYRDTANVERAISADMVFTAYVEGHTVVFEAGDNTILLQANNGDNMQMYFRIALKTLLDYQNEEFFVIDVETLHNRIKTRYNEYIKEYTAKYN